MKAIAVVGAAWGDEGKGNVTNYYATPDTVVVRYCGGGNAGHTVVHNGLRHVFHHFGSGTLKGALTFLSRYFVHNPILYFQELKTLRAFGIEPKVYVDPAGLVTTHVDMMLNQLVEEARNHARHGSCGVGLNETMQRQAQHPFTVADLLRLAPTPDRLREHLLAIMTHWVPERLHQLGVEPSDLWLARLESSEILTTFVDYCVDYSRAVIVQPDIIANSSHVVFEGAQGLLLDEQHYFFPHVTHSRTGLPNVMALAGEAGIVDLDVVYVARAYATRHGAGPFPHEVAGLQYEDRTNLPNPWQGELRFGELDLDLLAESVQHDLEHAVLPVRPSLALTCLDQIGERAVFWQGGERREVAAGELPLIAATAIGGKPGLRSFGPCSVDIRPEPAG